MTKVSLSNWWNMKTRQLDSRVAKWLAITQGSYYLTTGVWPTLHLDSFLAVTGPKTDLWLVQAFGWLIGAQGAVLLLLAARSYLDVSLRSFGLASAVALACIDLYFVGIGAISSVYLLDAVIEIAIAVLWSGSFLFMRGARSGLPVQFAETGARESAERGLVDVDRQSPRRREVLSDSDGAEQS